MRIYTDIFADNQEFLNNRTGSNLQGNIMQPHGREHVAFMTLHWPENSIATPDLKNYLANLAFPPVDHPQRISINSAAMQQAERGTYGRSASPRLFMGFYLTHQGFEFLQRENNYSEIYGHLKDIYMRADMNDKEGWDNKMKNIPQMMFMLAHSSESFLRDTAAHFENIFKNRFGANEKTFIEYGRVYRNRFGQSMEHFGYADGLSQPWFIPKGRGQKFPNQNEWNPIRNITDFLTGERETGKHCYGSFLAYRKYEQDVLDFINTQNARAAQSGKTPELAGAEMFGRFKEGSPIVSESNSARTKEELKNRELYLFDYKSDVDGNRCPFSAHVRKMNNRQNINGDMIIRRGVPYGNRELLPNGEFNLKNDPSENVGLHFLSFQNSFETFQDLLPGNPDGDAVLGDLKNGLAKLKGGANYYAPSIKFFEQLAQ